MKIFLLILLLPLFSHGQIITTFAGGGSTLGDGGPATAALINDPSECVLLQNGTWYIASGVDNRVRKIDTNGIITTIAGTGSGGHSGDGGPATLAQIDDPSGIALDTKGNLFFTDPQNNYVRKVILSTGTISTVCGTGTAGYNGDNIAASTAQLNNPNGICVDKSGNVYMADVANNRIRKIDTSGIITTVAGTGILGFSGDGGPATLAQLNFPVDVTFDKAGELYLSDGTNRRIRKVGVNGIISTIAGNGTATYSGDDIPATNAQLTASVIRFDYSGNLYIADPYNYRVYKIDQAGIFHCIAGNGMITNNGDGGPATAAGIDYPCGLTFDTCNNLYVANVNYNRIRKVEFNTPPCAYLGVPDAHANIELSIYPNPAYDVVNVNGLAAEAEYALVNITGIIEQQGELKEGDNTISIRNLPPGLYILEMTDADGNRTVNKIIKQ